MTEGVVFGGGQFEAGEVNDHPGQQDCDRDDDDGADRGAQSHVGVTRQGSSE
jgi:hypothetical protein